MADPLKQALEALKGYFAPAGEGTEQHPYAPWQKTGQEAISGAVEGLKGLAGVEGPKESTANTVGLLAGAAMPFAKFGKLKGLHSINEVPTVFHGTPNVVDVFDLAKANKFDNLGSYIHAAEAPAAADMYAKGAVGKGLSRNIKGQGNIIPVTSSSQNVLDLSARPISGEDWEALKPMVEHVASGYQSPIIDRPDTVLYTGQELAQNILERAPRELNSSYPRGWTSDIQFLLNDPELLKLTPFDAIRYYENGSKPYWAFPRPEQLSTPWGVPLGELKKLKP